MTVNPLLRSASRPQKSRRAPRLFCRANLCSSASIRLRPMSTAAVEVSAFTQIADQTPNDHTGGFERVLQYANKNAPINSDTNARNIAQWSHVSLLSQCQELWYKEPNLFIMPIPLAAANT